MLLSMLILGAKGLTGRFPTGVLLGLVAWIPRRQTTNALLPVSFQRDVGDFQPTASVYRGRVAGLAGKTGLGKARTPAADVARVAAGERLCTPVIASRDGKWAFGYLLLGRPTDGSTVMEWRPRGVDVPATPVVAGPVAVEQGRTQAHGMAVRFGLTVYVRSGGNVYWMRPHDAELLSLLFEADTESETQVSA